MTDGNGSPMSLTGLSLLGHSALRSVDPNSQPGLPQSSMLDPQVVHEMLAAQLAAMCATRLDLQQDPQHGSQPGPQHGLQQGLPGGVDARPWRRQDPLPHASPQGDVRHPWRREPSPNASPQDPLQHAAPQGDPRHPWRREQPPADAPQGGAPGERQGGGQAEEPAGAALDPAGSLWAGSPAAHQQHAQQGHDLPDAGSADHVKSDEDSLSLVMATLSDRPHLVGKVAAFCAQLSMSGAPTHQRFHGYLRAFDRAAGHGLIACPEIPQAGSRGLVARESVVRSLGSIVVGRPVSFKLGLSDASGELLAWDVEEHTTNHGGHAPPRDQQWWMSPNQAMHIPHKGGGKAVRTPNYASRKPIGEFVGQIKVFLEDKGFGFITCADVRAHGYQNDTFLHHTERNSFSPGDFVKFTCTLNAAGKPQAHSLSLAEGEEAAAAAEQAAETATRERAGWADEAAGGCDASSAGETLLGRFLGRVCNPNASGGYAFIQSSELSGDAFLPADQFSTFQPGDAVSFTAYTCKRGQTWAKDLAQAEDLDVPDVSAPLSAAWKGSEESGCLEGKWKPGDWECPACGDWQFARNSRCRRCGVSRPIVAGAGAAVPAVKAVVPAVKAVGIAEAPPSSSTPENPFQAHPDDAAKFDAFSVLESQPSTTGTDQPQWLEQEKEAQVEAQPKKKKKVPVVKPASEESREHVLGQYTGRIKSLSPAGTYALIECAELRAQGWTKDTYAHKVDLNGFGAGDDILFTAFMNARGNAQAMELNAKGGGPATKRPRYA